MEQLRNIGPVSARWLEACGVTTVEELEALGAVEVYRRVEEAFPRQTSLNLLYALEGAILDLPWNDLPPSVRERLRAAAGQ